MTSYATTTDRLYITRGRAWTWPMSWTDTNGDPIDISGMTLLGSINWDEDDCEAGSFELTEAGGEITNRVDGSGTWDVELTAVQTLLIPQTTTARLSFTLIDTAGVENDFMVPVYGRTIPLNED